jgi:hypothetical protein
VSGKIKEYFGQVGPGGKGECAILIEDREGSPAWIHRQRYQVEASTEAQTFLKNLIAS